MAAPPEPEPPYAPSILTDMPSMVGETWRFKQPPRGVILHGSHSGIARSTWQEFKATATYAQITPYAFTATIGDDAVALHLPLTYTGWHARACSHTYIGAEFAQPGANGANEDISDGQVRAFCWLFREARAVWPTLPRHLPTHSELDGTVEYGPLDGKWDCFKRSEETRADDLRQRINQTLDSWGVL